MCARADFSRADEKIPGGWQVKVDVPVTSRIGQLEVGIHYVINGVKHFWTGLQWVSKEYLRTVMNAPREHALYDRHNKRRAAVAATKRNRRGM